MHLLALSYYRNSVLKKIKCTSWCFQNIGRKRQCFPRMTTVIFTWYFALGALLEIFFPDCLCKGERTVESDLKELVTLVAQEYQIEHLINRIFIFFHLPQLVKMMWKSWFSVKLVLVLGMGWVK